MHQPVDLSNHPVLGGYKCGRRGPHLRAPHPVDWAFRPVWIGSSWRDEKPCQRGAWWPLDSQWWPLKRKLSATGSVGRGSLQSSGRENGLTTDCFVPSILGPYFCICFVTLCYDKKKEKNKNTEEENNINFLLRRVARDGGSSLARLTRKGDRILCILQISDGDPKLEG
jgi:hypothetical protein